MGGGDLQTDGVDEREGVRTRSHLGVRSDILSVLLLLLLLFLQELLLLLQLLLLLFLQQLLLLLLVPDRLWVCTDQLRDLLRDGE